ncbi:MAG: MFS transporter [Clostridia bacterium]|nr:MFS transporter [Clostridia bacterium]
MVKNNFKYTITASFLGYTTQAIMLNFPPLLFVFFGEEFGITPIQITVLISSNFVLELLVDIIASKYAEKIGYRKLVICADVFAILGLVVMALATVVLPKSFVFYGLMVAMMLCGVGGGLMEVLISPIVEACPTKNKAGFMSLLHSFYCWGQFAVVLLSTLFFKLVGIERWYIIACVWTIIPLIGLILFTFAPINHLVEEGKGAKLGTLLKSGTFWLFLIMMLCAGASELTMSQWASYFAESALGVEKWVGDLLGPCMFALTMALTRVFYAKVSEKLKLDTAILISSVICVATYVLAIISSNPILSLIGCATCGFGCGVLWPATYSLASQRIPNGGVLMFGVLALLGDGGCLVGPSLAGSVSSLFNDDIRVGFLVALIFPVLMAVSSLVLVLKRRKNSDQ